ncbi:MAG: VWA domain-containing protein [Gemmatimonadetes bacterium]|nr:VWA domain-containing protein [Gemmatimonadota bacterium]
MTFIAWERPLLLVAALLVAALGVVSAWLWHRRRAERLATLGSEAALRRLAPAARSAAGLRRAARLGVASVLAAVAFAGPRFGASREIIRTRGGDVVLAMDASLSMLADDERPSRLERMKQEVRRFRAASPGDRVALIAFAGRAYVLSPLTSDDGALELFLDNLDPSIVGQPGTALAPAITGALDLLAAAQGGAGKAIVLLTDGEGFDDREAAIRAAQRARRDNVRLVTVGFGTAGGSTIPLRTRTGVEAKRDENGEIVVSRYAPETLAEVARVADGEFIAADASDKGTRIARALSSLEARRRAAEAGLAMPARYQWLLGVAVLLLLFDAWHADGGRISARWVPRALRRRAVVAPVVLLALGAALAPRVAEAQGMAARGLEEFKAGRTLEAVRSYRNAVNGGDRTPRTLYNFGTVLLAADSLDSAIDALERAAFGSAPALRERALYNLGLAQLRRARRAEGEDRLHSVRGAMGAFRSLLLAHPDDADTRWNYELALRLRRQPPPMSNSGGAREDELALPQSRDPQGMSEQQAQQLLDAAARDERDTQARRRRAPQRDRPPGGKDW